MASKAIDYTTTSYSTSRYAHALLQVSKMCSDLDQDGDGREVRRVHLTRPKKSSQQILHDSESQSPLSLPPSPLSSCEALSSSLLVTL